MSSNKRLRLSDPSSITSLASTSSSSAIPKRFKYDVFISFRGEDTRKTFVGHLYQALKQKGLETFKDDEEMKQGKTIDNQLIQAIKDSRLFIIVFSKNYASSSWCLDELVEIMECQKTGEQTAYPVFLDVEPTQVRKQSGAFGEAFLQNKNKDAAGKWIEALKGASKLVGRELQATANGHEAEFIKKIVGEISLELRSISFGFDEKLVGMETRGKDVVDCLEMGIDDDVWMIGIKGMGGAGKTTTARAVFDRLSANFESKSFVENVREVSEPSMSGLKKLQEQVLSRVLKEKVTLDSVYDGKNMMQKRMQGIKVLLVLDDVNHIDQLVALAGQTNWFKKGSRIIVTTRDEQVLQAHRVNFRDIDKVDHRVKIRDIDLLSNEEAILLLSRHAFGRASPSQGFEKLSEKVVSYAAGLPLTVKVLGLSLCGTNEHEWVKAIDRLKKFPPEEILKKLELSYESLEYDYQQIFLDIACMLKGFCREDAIRILECCGFEPITGLRVLEQRSLITVNEYGFLGMHDQIEEMGKNIVRREHRDEPKKHSRLWIKEEFEDILANDEGTIKTKCLELRNSNTNAGIVMKGLGKMKQLRYLRVDFQYQDYAEVLDNTAQYFSNSLKYLKCSDYPFLYLPKTFQANNLVGLEMKWSRMVQLWEEGEKKFLPKLKFLSLTWSKLTTFDFSITPNLETLSLEFSFSLVKLYMPASCQKLNYLHISWSKLSTFDLGLTPNLEKLSLNHCADFEELHVSSACPNLKFLELRESRLRSLDLELFPNLKRLDLECRDNFKYDVFLSFWGGDTRNNFIGLLYEALTTKGIVTYKDDVKIRKGKTTSDELIKTIKDSRFYIIVFSKNYASSSWCLDELVKIMECQKKDEHTAYSVFYDVGPTQVRKQIGDVGQAFEKHENEEAAGKWREALKEATYLLGWWLNDWDESELIKKLVGLISLELRSIRFGSDQKLVGMETRVKDVVDSLEMGIDDDVWMIGIKGMGGAGKTATARAVFDRLSADFEAKSFVANVREVSNGLVSGLKILQEEVLSTVLNERVTLDSVYDGKNMMQERMQGIKVLLVLDDVDHIEQLEALAGGPNWFKPGSRIIVTTRNEKVLEAHRVNFRDIDLLSNKVNHRVKIRDIDLLSDEEAIILFSRHAFGRVIPSQGYKELSGKVVRYAAGLPLILKLLGSFLGDKDEHEWKDAIERLKEIPLKETQEMLELSDTSLEKYFIRKYLVL